MKLKFRTIDFKIKIILIIALGYSAFPALAQEEVRYISDILYVPLRSGQGNEYRIINAALRSGTELVMLESPEGSEWSRVRTPNGTEGWIPNQYLSSEVPARTQLAQAQTQLALLNEENARFKKENAQLLNTNKALEAKTSNEVANRTDAEQQLQQIKAISANAIELDQRYRDLLEKHQLMQTELDTLKAENERLVNDQRMNFLFYGAGILIFGMIFATILPSLRFKKKYSEWA